MLTSASSPDLLPAFCRLQYGQATKSWDKSGYEARPTHQMLHLSIWSAISEVCDVYEASRC